MSQPLTRGDMPEPHTRVGTSAGESYFDISYRQENTTNGGHQTFPSGVPYSQPQTGTHLTTEPAGEAQYQLSGPGLAPTALPPFSNLRSDLSTLAEVSMLEAHGMGAQPDSDATRSSRAGMSSQTGSADPPSDPGESAPQQRKPRKRREKPHIDLAPDQPPTTQGKARARVYVACLQCRQRKIRCDGAKPVCHNCNRRPAGGPECSYDAQPKRRGPDRTPGARQRVPKDEGHEVGEAGGPVRRRRRRREESSTTSSLKSPLDVPSSNVGEDFGHLPSPTAIPAFPLDMTQSPIDGGASLEYLLAPLASMAGSADYPQTSCCGLNNCPPSACPTRGSGIFQVIQNMPLNPLCTTSSEDALIAAMPASFITQVDENGNEVQDDTVDIDIGSQPSLNFTRKIWWDSVLSLYLDPHSTHLQPVTGSQREVATAGITGDLQFLFRTSNYWFSFFHIPSFFRQYFDPQRREQMQPCLMLGLLAMATFWQSSEIELGDSGRRRALSFRDAAQCALDASMNSGWLDETVAQAAWLLALFEVCAHPYHSTERSTSSMTYLDSLIRGLALTSVDVDDPQTSMFSHGTVPHAADQRNSVLLPNFDARRTTQSLREGMYAVHPHQYPPSTAELGVGIGINAHTNVGSPDVGCSCASHTLMKRMPGTAEHVPLWASTPAWNDSWTTAEIRKESCRRLCWSAMTLAAGHISYTTANKSYQLDLFIANPANYALLFSGESIMSSPTIHSPRISSAKDTIWALYDRAFLLWHGCMRMRNDPSVSDARKAEFAYAAWLEADALEEVMNKHMCGIERAFIYQGREYLFNTRMCISYEFSRYIPLPSTTNPLFNRKKAEDWLHHQATVAQRFMQGLHIVTGNATNVLARRPFFVFWFMGQISRYYHTPLTRWSTLIYNVLN
ncbi:hypothetical protein HGRIS_006254 [Hohenbuehelia grisea]|uniref:Zn(2)-C6 fungal-type domain-containing protein n=1 Tax=Hohenbuehelia grisea TaxID=104357 RepID=A0ABR3JZB0_9AGAR